MVSIAAFQAVDPGSIPGHRSVLSHGATDIVSGWRSLACWLPDCLTPVLRGQPFCTSVENTFIRSLIHSLIHSFIQPVSHLRVLSVAGIRHIRPEYFVSDRSMDFILPVNTVFGHLPYHVGESLPVVCRLCFKGLTHLSIRFELR